MKRISGVASLVAAVVVVLTVSSCAPAVHPSSAPLAHPNSHPTAKPHTKAPQPAVPVVRVPVKCASLFTNTAAAALIDAPVKVSIGETTVPVDIVDIAARQYGSLDCVWGGDRQDSGYTESLTIDITPDAATGFAANLSAFSEENPPVVLNTAGDKSVYGCDVEGAINCVSNMLVGQYWVTARILELSNPAATSAVAHTRIQQVLTTVAAALKTAKAGPAWIPPGAPLPAFCSAAGSTAQVNAALGAGNFEVTGEDDGYADAASYPQLPGIYSQCAWQAADSTGNFVSVALLKGGAWVIPSLAGKLNNRAYMLGAYASMNVPGAAAAAGNCSSDADECEVAVSIGSLLAVIDMDDPSDAQAQAALAKLVADIKAS